MTRKTRTAADVIRNIELAAEERKREGKMREGECWMHSLARESFPNWTEEQIEEWLQCH